MNKINIIKKIKDKEMDRKDFLKFGGMAVLGIVGLRGVVALLSENSTKTPNTSNQTQTQGYGGKAYGA